MSTSLADTLALHGISLRKEQIQKLEEYSNLLWDWNERINLTRHTDYKKFVARDLVDSLSLAEFLRRGERILDVGTGGGVPGIPLAILRPDLRVELCDSTGKKTLAVSKMIQELRLRIPVHHAKADAILQEKGQRYTTLTIRAVSRLASLLRHLAPCWSSFDRMLLVKGPKWTEERGEARHHNLMNKIALRCLKTYTTMIYPTEKESDSSGCDDSQTEFFDAESTEMESTSVESVILQLCLKENFEQLEKVIDGHLSESRTAQKRNEERGRKRQERGERH